MEIVICGVPRSGNVLLRNIIIEILRESGEDYYGEEHFTELDQRMFLFIRRFLAKNGIVSEHIPCGGYVFEDGRAALKSLHRMSNEDYLFLRAPLEGAPTGQIIPTHSLPGDIPQVSKMLCTMRNLPDVIDSTLNFIFPDMQVYIERGEMAPKDPFMMRWGSLDVFDRFIRKIAAHYKSLMENEHRFFKVPYEALVEAPSQMIRQIAERIGVEIDSRTADAVWRKLGNKGLMGKWNYHFRSDRKRYFRIRDFLTKAHLRVMEKHSINDLIVATGYDESLCYTKEHIAISEACTFKVHLPSHFRPLGMLEEEIAKNALVFGRNTMRYCGPKLPKKMMVRLSDAVSGYLDGERAPLGGKAVVLYGGGKLGRYVEKRLPENVTRVGYIENDDFSILKQNRFDAVVLCSIGHESAMEEKLIRQGLAPDQIRAWYEVV